MIVANLVIRYLVSIAFGYLLGSVPFGLLLAKLATKKDVREWGSGNIGAGKKIGILAGLLDFGKGAAAVSIAKLIISNNYIMVGRFGFGPLLGAVLAGLAAVAGHNWSIYLKFHGGKGVATFFGGLVALIWFVALFGGEVLALGATSTLFMSLGSLAGVVGTYAILIPLTIINGWPIDYLLYAFGGTAMIIFQHRGNIVRLFKGIERRIGERAEKVRQHSGSPHK